MAISLTEDQQDFVDEMLFLNRWLPAVMFIRDSASCRLNDTLDAVDSRTQILGIDFNGSALARVAAFAGVDKVREPICGIEGSWDGDSLGWFIRLSAITEQPSVRHPHYTDYGLCLVRSVKDQIRYATVLGEEVARIAGTVFYLTSMEVDDKKRWWDIQPATMR